MLARNRTVWETRIQNVDALLTARGPAGDEIYYLATICQVSLDPAIVSASPNPQYPICEAILESSWFGLNFLREDQRELVRACKTMKADHPDKLRHLGIPFERSVRGTPLLRDCLVAFECALEDRFPCGDHLTILGRPVDAPTPFPLDAAPHRFGGRDNPVRDVLKRVLCATGIYDVIWWLMHRREASPGIAEGTRRYISAGNTSLEGDDTARTAVTSGRTRSSGRGACVPPGICLVGCGWWGRVHALHLSRLQGDVRRFFVSRDHAKARDFVTRFDGEAFFSSFEEALEDSRVNAVVLAVPHDLHAKLARAALLGGKHVLVEKPLALTEADGEELVDIAERSGLILAVAEQYRLAPVVREAGEILCSGELGAVTLARAVSVGPFAPEQAWKWKTKTMGGGVLLDVGIHYVSLFRLWFGEPGAVWATRPPHRLDGFEPEDSLVAVLEFEGGPTATLEVSWSAYRRAGASNIELMATEGSLELLMGRGELHRYEPLADGHWANRARTVIPWRLRRYVRPILERLPRNRRRAYRFGGDSTGSGELIRDFVDSVSLRRPPAVPGSEGLADLRVVQACYRSLSSGGRVVPL